MIISFGSKETEKVWNQEFSRKLPTEIQAMALRKLFMIHHSKDLTDMKIPASNHLEQLKGNLKDFHSIRINKQWRIIFKWQSGLASKVEIVDYH